MAFALPLLKSGEYIDFSSFFQSSANLDMVRADSWRHTIAVLTRPFVRAPQRTAPNRGNTVRRNGHRGKVRSRRA